MNVIPVINCADKVCAEKKLAVVKTFLPEGELLHLDVTDGIFSAHKTWSDPFAWASLASPFPLEVHLMVEQPEEHADNWLTAGAKRLVVHIETITPASLEHLIVIAESHRGEIMLSSNPETDPEAMTPFIDHAAGRINAFQVLAVHPGAAGQPFMPSTLQKISLLRQAMPNAIIEVDGGMNPETVAAVKAAGADTVVSSSYIFNATDPKLAYQALKNL
jgi:ribulose-phosphate 3-epimerase